MATVNKDFRVKHGIVVEGSTATVGGSNVLTENSTEFLQDTTAAMFTNGTSTGISFSYNDTTGVIDATVSSTPVFADKITFEGATPDDYETVLQVTEPTQDNTITLPNATTTLVGTGTSQTLTNKTISGSNNTISNIGNSSLTNSSVTINGFSISLGGSATYSTDNIGEGTTNLYFTNERAQDAVGLAINAGTQNGITVTYTDGSDKIDFAVADQFPSKTTTNLAEGTNLYFTDERAVDAVAQAIANGTQTNISITYNDEANSLSFNATGGVSSISGTANEVEVSNVGTAYTIGLPDNITVGGNITINGVPSADSHAVTKGYVDAFVQGLHIHASADAATTANISLAPAPASIDGVTLTNNMRVLVKNQDTASQNGIYVYSTSTGNLTRATDFDSASEIQGGDFVFVTAGTVNNDTGWVQTEKVTTVGTDPIYFTQFSGAGTYLAGNGLTLTGNTFSINTAVTADLSTAQTLTNKTLASPVVSGLYLSDNEIVIEGNPDTNETRLVFTNPTDDRVITFKDETGTVAFTADITSAINALTTTDIEEGTNLYFTDERAQDAVGNALGSGLAYNDTTGAISNSGVLSITGTSNQVIASGSTGSVTLSLPQNIATTSSPTFAGVTVGQITFTDALTGTAVASLTNTDPTVIDSWAASAYRSGKYVVQMINGNDIEVLEVLVTVDGNNNVYLTEYADVQSNTQLGTTDADYSGGNVRLLVTSTSGTTVKVHRTLIEA